MILSASLPNPPVYRLYMTIDFRQRMFGVYNMRDERFTNVITTRRKDGFGISADPQHPMENKCRLTGSVTRINDYEHDDFTRMGYLWVVVDYSKDIFTFHSTYPDFLGQLRFIARNLSCALLSPLPADHWYRRIQQLAIPLPDPGPFCTQFDLEIFKDMPDLKRVYLVAGNRCHHMNGAAPGSGGFVRLTRRDRVHIQWGQVASSCYSITDTNAQTTHDLLRQALAPPNRIEEVEICVVADAVKVEDIPFGDKNQNYEDGDWAH